MANPALMTALGTLGAGFSAYGRAQQERDALKRAMEQQEFERGRLAMADKLQNEATQRAITQQNLENTRRTERDILDAILGGLRPAEQGVSIGGQTFGMPRTREDEIADRKRRFKLAYPNISDAQAELLARGDMKPGEILIDPGTARPGSTRRPTTMTTTAPRSLFSSRYSPLPGSGR
jgi:hypothetical protein